MNRNGRNYVINIGRQLGSGGKEIGEKLAARLGIDFYDKELIKLASEESGLCKEFFERADEKASQGIIGGLFGMRFPFISEGAIPSNNCLSNDALFKVQSDGICQLYRVDEEKAEEMMEKADKRRSEYYNYYSYKTWGAAATYHLCIDSSVLGVDETVRFIEEFVVKKLGLIE